MNPVGCQLSLEISYPGRYLALHSHPASAANRPGAAGRTVYRVAERETLEMLILRLHTKLSSRART